MELSGPELIRTLKEKGDIKDTKAAKDAMMSYIKTSKVFKE